MIGSARKRLLIALAFLLPNLLGFIVFTAGPVAFSLVMSFTDWALTRHNRYSDTAVQWVGIENYQRVLVGDEAHLFWDYFGNTAFLMLGIPLGIAGSLALALMLTALPAPASTPRRARYALLGIILTLLAVAGTWLLTTPGPPPDPASGSELLLRSTETGLTDLTRYDVARLRSNAAVLAAAAAGLVATSGLAFGPMFFRGLFYLPSLLSGVAMFLLWKTLYRPEGGLINAGLAPILGWIDLAARSSPPLLWHIAGIALAAATVLAALFLVIVGLSRLIHRDSGPASFVGRLAIVATMLAVGLGSAYVLVQLPQRSLLPSGRAPLSQSSLSTVIDRLATDLPSAPPDALRRAAAGLGDTPRTTDAISALTAAAGDSAADRAAVTRAVLDAAPLVYEGLTSGDGLQPPLWLVDARWAKTALIIMGIWAGLGGGTMLLFLAGLSNIPPELYEAASIDGATGWSRFIHVTWPQLAPTTFFIVIMSTIGGLQGGFEQAMVMTQGKADTIVLAYYIYNIAFTDQFQLGLASAIAWVMFILIFAMTALNFRLGSQMTGD
ncbi:MAG: sugar ABC transporter permease [Planctomycetota bacterium]|nr:sugar ABC transporter permease [Planctomycetota bacterium]